MRHPSRLRLLIAAGLFTAWIGWLVFLAATTTKPVVLSRPQFLHADAYVIAELGHSPSPLAGASVVSAVAAVPFPALPWAAIEAAGRNPAESPSPLVTVREVPWSSFKLDRVGQKVFVSNLGDVRENNGWNGPGMYILPLTRTTAGKQDRYRLTILPRSPGYPPGTSFEVVRERIYPANDRTRRELEELIKEFHP
jgi:hypothetical protein